MIRLTEFWAVLFHYHRNERIAMMKMPKKMQPSCFMASLGSVSLINSGKTETRAAKTIVWKKICFFTIKIWPYLYLEIPLQKKEESRKFWLLKTALSPRTRLRWPRAFPHLLSTFGLCQPPTWDRVKLEFSNRFEIIFTSKSHFSTKLQNLQSHVESHESKLQKLL